MNQVGGELIVNWGWDTQPHGLHRSTVTAPGVTIPGEPIDGVTVPGYRTLN
ncbi:hypothetical protein GCM10023184_14490 [Flaviaesturariibacter amylovorans]|uniref:Uncharacterized protein n=1 Tax=Flaviaesturariibacter amylovorans TaxID=1084520 RepID=A0ABP8GKM8_9BACT